MLTKLSIRLFLFISLYGAVCAADFEQLKTIKRADSFFAAATLEAADAAARDVTNYLLDPSEARLASAEEGEAIINSHLHMELYYAFNTEFGNKTRNHRLVYDFLSSIKDRKPNDAQKDHITILTVLSLAAQEFFSNQKSTVKDLRNRVRRELRYGLFKEVDGDLNIRNLVLFEDSIEEKERKKFNRIVYCMVDGDLIGQLKGMLKQFELNTLRGHAYRPILDKLKEKFAAAKLKELPLLLPEQTLRDTLKIEPKIGEAATTQLVEMGSKGDGMCGEHSLNIPTDGACSGIKKGNGRDKILSAILDNATDEDAKRLYLLNSQYLDKIKFVDLMRRHLTTISDDHPIKASLVQKLAENEAFERVKLLEMIDAKGIILSLEEKRDLSNAVLRDRLNASKKAEVIGKISQLQGVKLALNEFNALLNDGDRLMDLVATDDGRTKLNNVLNGVIKFQNVELETLLLQEIVDGVTVRQSIQSQRIAITDAEKAAKEKCKKDKEHFLALKKVAEKSLEEYEKSCLDVASKFKLIAKQITKIEKDKKNHEKYSFYAKELANDIVLLKEETEKLKDLKQNNPIEVQKLEQLTGDLEKTKSDYDDVEEDYSERDNLLVAMYLFVGKSLGGFINESMLPGSGHKNAFKVEDLCRDYTFTDTLAYMLEILKSNLTGKLLMDLMDDLQSVDELINKEVNNGFFLKALELIEQLPTLPVELQAEALKAEMEATALKEGELKGWLPCDSIYVQLWAVINNLNIFVFTDLEDGRRSPVDLIVRLRDSQYSQVTQPHPFETKGKALSTVILTSRTAKNVFLNKSPAHYDKLIQPDDLSDMAKAIRHINWMDLGENERYATYTGPESLEIPRALDIIEKKEKEDAAVKKLLSTGGAVSSVKTSTSSFSWLD